MAMSKMQPSDVVELEVGCTPGPETSQDESSAPLAPARIMRNRPTLKCTCASATPHS